LAHDRIRMLKSEAMKPKGKNRTTPLMRQFTKIKTQYPDAILFFRMGDFYEMFHDDAVEASKILNIALTSRDKDKGEPIPLCGVPFHAAQPYISKLLAAGKKVAVCEQTEDPRKAKGLVKRDVVRVVTPALTTEENDLELGKPSFLACIHKHGDRYGLCRLDISTGTIELGSYDDPDDLRDILFSSEPREILISENSPEEIKQFAGEAAPVVTTLWPHDSFAPEPTKRLFDQQFQSIEAPFDEAAICAAGAALDYLIYTQKQKTLPLKAPTTISQAGRMVLDESTIRNLELLYSIQERTKRGSLLGLLDETKTPMGSRLLRGWLLAPLMDTEKIEDRLDSVEELVKKPSLRRSVREALARTCDLERLMNKISIGSALPKDLINLKNGLAPLAKLKETCRDFEAQMLGEAANNLDSLEDVRDRIERALVEPPPATPKDGGVFKEGYHSELDELIAVSRSSKKLVADIERRERKRTKIQNLRVRYNRVFGYYIEITKSQLNLVPPDYERKQTLVGSERFMTKELKEVESKILSAQERRIELESELYQELKDWVDAQSERVRKTAHALALIDVLSTFSEIAQRYNYTRPEVTNSDKIEVEEGRHPVVEQLLKDELFVPNDLYVDTQRQQLLIITGPNMAGKSTYIRQAALIVLMAQIGSFVPAKSAKIGVVDKIFTRVGASDNIARGLSTFMAEMVETANILKHATKRSLLILDEIGRGTSTFDGISISWAVAESIHDSQKLRCRTLFATHFHELADLARTKPRVKNYTIAVREREGKIIFLRRVIPGAASHSYGIEVAKLAGLPTDVVERAKEILKNLESAELDAEGQPRAAKSAKGAAASIIHQPSLFDDKKHPLVEELKQIDINTLTPLEALNLLAELTKKANQQS